MVFPKMETLCFQNERRPDLCHVWSSLSSAREIEGLGALYPNVKRLALPVHGSRGNRAEVALYQTIGHSFPKLRHLSLHLDASSRPVHMIVPPQLIPLAKVPEFQCCSARGCSEGEAIRPFEERAPHDALGMAYRGLTNGDIMDFMVNCALDSKLAKQIFLAVSSASLETMVVRSGGVITTSRHADGIVSTGLGTGRALGWGSMQFGMEHYIAGLQRHWVVEK